MKLRYILFLVAAILICGCGTTSVVRQDSPHIVVSESGIEAVGTGVSQNEKISGSIAIRMARTDLVEYFNMALANVDKQLGLQDVVAHKEKMLQKSKVIETERSVWRKNITTVVRVVVSFEEICKWVGSYYDNLPSDDMLRMKITKDKFSELMYKHLNINF